MSSQPDKLPYGLRQVMITPYLDGQGSVLAANSYPLPVAMTLGFSETEQYDELRGDDVLVAVHGRGPQVDWSLEAGGMDMTCWSIISGGSVIESGVAPNRTTRLRKSGDDVRPYFRIDGRAISDSGGDLIGRIYRAKANGRLQADLRGGAFQTSRIDGVGLPLIADAGRWLYEFIAHEAETAIPGTPEANPLPTPVDLQVTSISSTTVGLMWDQVSGFGGSDAYKIQKSADAGVTWTDISPTATVNSASVASLTTATAYQFRVVYMKGGTVAGDPSHPVLVTTS
jgi:hypothetical protein